MSDKKVIADDSAPVELEAGQVIVNKMASKKHWRELSKINQSAGGGLPIHEPQFKKGGGVRSQKQYNKEVDAYKWFVVDLSNKRAISGWGFKSDANDSLKDYDGDKNFKVVSERALTSIGVENPKERFKKMKNGGSVDDKIYAPKGYVFAKLGSHRTREKVKKAEAKYVSVWTFGGGQGMAGSSTIFLYEKDYNKIKNITGVSKSTNYLRANSNHWFARDEDDNLRKVFNSIHQKYEQGGDLTINFTYEIGGL